MLRVSLLSAMLASSVALAGGDDEDQKLRIDVPHQLSLTDAHARAQMLFDYWHQRYGVEVTWQGESAHVLGRVMGIDIDAVLVVGSSNIGGEAEDPGPFFRGLAKSYITMKLQKYMHPQFLEP